MFPSFEWREKVTMLLQLAVPAVGSTRYSPVSHQSFHNLDVPESMKALFCGHSKPCPPHLEYIQECPQTTAVQSCMVELGKLLVPPKAANAMLTFTSWLLVRRNVSGTKVGAYLSSPPHYGVESPNYALS